jgi:hypothetical protein
MNNIPNSFSDNIKKIYEKAGYLDKYGGSVIACVLLLLAFFCVFSYLYVMNHIKPIKSNWVNERCKPEVLPFAGLINTPPGESKIKFTADNFAACTTDILSGIVAFFLKPLYFVTSIVVNLFGELGKAVNAVRGIMAYIRQQIDIITKHILLRIFGTLVPIQKVLIKMKALFGKIQGVMVTSLMTAIGSFYALKSFIGAFMEMLIITLVIAAAAIIALWILPFTWPAAAAGTVFFLLISVPLAIIVGWMVHILNLTTSRSVPGKPGCFDGETLFDLMHEKKKISEIEVGDKLIDGSIVTGIFKLSYTGQDVYNLNDITITGSHKIFYNNELIYLREHPGAKRVKYNKEFVYCINTSSKKINLSGFEFADWDEIEDTDIKTLKKLKLLPKKSSINDIHRYLDGGFHGNTMIELEDGRSKKIKDIEVNEQLRFGQRVLGIVKIDARKLFHVKKYTYKNQEFVGGVNLQLFSALGKTSTLNMIGEPVKKPRYMYHLITDSGIFNVNGITFYDYSGGIEQILDVPQKLLKIF